MGALMASIFFFKNILKFPLAFQFRLCYTIGVFFGNGRDTKTKGWVEKEKMKKSFKSPLTQKEQYDILLALRGDKGSRVMNPPQNKGDKDAQ